jgi:hypothetical protein
VSKQHDSISRAENYAVSGFAAIGLVTMGNGTAKYLDLSEDLPFIRGESY